MALAASSACVALAIPAGARAQQVSTSSVDAPGAATNTLDSSSYDRGRNVSVLQRARPDYEALGIHLASFMVYPKLEVSGAYDDNIDAQQQGAVGDFIVSAAPEIDFHSTWSRDSVSGYVRARQDWYAQHGSENALQYGGGLAGRLDFGESSLTGGVDSGRYVLPRSVSDSTGLSTRRIPYFQTDLYAQLQHEFTRLRLSARVDYQDFSYQNGETSTGDLVFVADQDRHVLSYTGKAEFAVTPDAAVYLTATGNVRRYDLNPPLVPLERNSSGYEVDVGANIDFTHLVRGELQAGYLNQTYESSLFRTISGPSALAQVEWFPTELTTVTLRATRTLADAVVVGSAGYTISNASLRIDHELLRNLILTASAAIERDQYNGVGRNDDIDTVGVAANWLLTRRVGLKFGYAFVDQRSSGSAKGPTFADNRISLTTILQF